MLIKNNIIQTIGIFTDETIKKKDVTTYILEIIKNYGYYLEKIIQVNLNFKIWLDEQRKFCYHINVTDNSCRTQFIWRKFKNILKFKYLQVQFSGKT